MNLRQRSQDIKMKNLRNRKVAIVGSRLMSNYGREVIGRLMANLRNRVEIVTIRTRGCNLEIIKLGADKIIEGSNFQKMNQELADYADVLVIVEGGENSGTILLADKFVEQNKEVWVVPGRITDENSKGVNLLIKSGANILTEVADLTVGLQ